jgi:biotin carboxyl carrier protein
VGDTLDVVSPLPGVVVKVLVHPGDHVGEDDPVAILQSMKTEISIPAGLRGTIADILIKDGVEVDVGTPLMRLNSE